MSLSRAAAAVADLVWPLSCAGCERAGERWCPDCAAALAMTATPTSPIPRPAGLPPVWAVAAYGGSVRRAIVAWKDDGRHDLTGVLAGGLAAAVTAALPVLPRGSGGSGGSGGSVRSGLPVPAPVWLVPMPSRAGARRERGGDPVRELATRAAHRVRADGGSGCDVRVLAALRHVRAVADQAGLDAAARAANVRGALAVRPGAVRRLRTAPCLLVDDVVTTGSTLTEAAAAVVRAGGHPFGAAVVAATRRTAAGEAAPR